MSKKTKKQTDSEQAYWSWFRANNFIQCLYLEGSIEKDTYTQIMQDMQDIKGYMDL